MYLLTGNYNVTIKVGVNKFTYSKKLDKKYRRKYSKISAKLLDWNSSKVWLFNIILSTNNVRIFVYSLPQCTDGKIKILELLLII